MDEEWYSGSGGGGGGVCMCVVCVYNEGVTSVWV